MIISFSIENWMSFRDKATFSMVATRERQHKDRVPKLSKYKNMGVLPIAAVYGGNASGKSNLFKALGFVKEMVVNGTQPDNLIPVEPFLLDGKSGKSPSRFTFELLIDEIIYEFSFAVTRKAVLEEKLVLITNTNEKVLYDRHDGNIDFETARKDDLFLKFAFQGTRDNQLFLTNSVSQKVDTFRPVYDWFKHTLALIAPNSCFREFGKLIDDKDPLITNMSDMLRLLDTGISRLGWEEIPFETLSMPESVKTQFQEEVKEDLLALLYAEVTRDRLAVTRNNDDFVAMKLITYHSKTDGTEAKFEIQQESDGSQRIIDLVPIFLSLSAQSSNKVYVIDEIDRSLHTLLTRNLLEFFLEKCSTETRTQLLLTTHDVLLMDQQLLRRDEMWITERDSSGSSDLIAFSDYKDVRYDKDIRKSYLQGRMGGIPRILLGGTLASPCSPIERKKVE